MRQKLNIPCITSILFVILSTYVLFKIVGFDSDLDKLHIEGFKETKHNYSKSNVGACTPNDSFQYHDCQIKNPGKKDYKQLIETYPTYELSKDVSNMYNTLCPSSYVKNLKKLKNIGVFGCPNVSSKRFRQENKMWIFQSNGGFR